MSFFTDNDSYQNQSTDSFDQNAAGSEAGKGTGDSTGGSTKDAGKADVNDQSTSSSLLEWTRDIIVALVIALIISLVIKPTIVKESSMEPNFNSNDYIFLSKIAYKFGHDPKHGDVIVFRSNSENLLDVNGKHKLLIKRIIGLPGDEIKIANGEVYVNGELNDQSFTKDGETWVDYPGDDEVLELTVPEGEVFCMGDNREVSVDSRSDDVGCVDEDTIVGKAIFRLFPLSAMGTIPKVYE